ncbi:MAG: nucleoside deaminase [Neisseriaceae bacterium]
MEKHPLIFKSLALKLSSLQIISQRDLVREGALFVFARLRALYPGLTHSVLWRLYAVEQGLCMEAITSDVKQSLVDEIKKVPINRVFPHPSEMQYYMELALREANKAFEMQEVPVGAVIVQNQRVIATGYNQCLSGCYVGNHAELLAIKSASERLSNYRLENCDLYVTLEPCMMCTGAILQARVARVVYATAESKSGMVESFDCRTYRHMNHHTAFLGGVLADESRALLANFFSTRRT